MTPEVSFPVTLVKSVNDDHNCHGVVNAAKRRQDELFELVSHRVAGNGRVSIDASLCLKPPTMTSLIPPPQHPPAYSLPHSQPHHRPQSLPPPPLPPQAAPTLP